MENSLEIILDVNSDFSGDLDKRRSLTSYLFTFEGTVMSWKALLQHATPLSTTEAKYMTISEAIKESIWLKGIFSKFYDDDQGITLFCDS